MRMVLKLLNSRPTRIRLLPQPSQSIGMKVARTVVLPKAMNCAGDGVGLSRIYQLITGTAPLESAAGSNVWLVRTRVPKGRLAHLT
jgi:hypothetical protein